MGNRIFIQSDMGKLVELTAITTVKEANSYLRTHPDEGILAEVQGAGNTPPLACIARITDKGVSMPANLK